MLYVHRYIRLTPLLVVTIMISSTLMRFLGNGPLWPSIAELIRDQCERHWLSTLFYVQNYVNVDDIVSIVAQNKYIRHGYSNQCMSCFCSVLVIHGTCQWIFSYSL